MVEAVPASHHSHATGNVDWTTFLSALPLLAPPLQAPSPLLPVTHSSSVTKEKRVETVNLFHHIGQWLRMSHLGVKSLGFQSWVYSLLILQTEHNIYVSKPWFPQVQKHIRMQISLGWSEVWGPGPGKQWALKMCGPPPDASSCPGSPWPHDSWSQSIQVEAHNVKRGEKDGPQEVTEALAVSPPTNPADAIYIRWGAGVVEASLTQIKSQVSPGLLKWFIFVGMALHMWKEPSALVQGLEGSGVCSSQLQGWSSRRPGLGLIYNSLRFPSEQNNKTLHEMSHTDSQDQRSHRGSKNRWAFQLPAPLNPRRLSEGSL